MNCDYFTDSFRHGFARCLFLFVFIPCMFLGMYVYASCGFYEIDLNFVCSETPSYNLIRLYKIFPLLFLVFSRFNGLVRFFGFVLVSAKTIFLGFCFCCAFQDSFQTISVISLSLDFVICLVLLIIYKNSLLFQRCKNDKLKSYFKRNYKNIVFDIICILVVLLLVY